MDLCYSPPQNLQKDPHSCHLDKVGIPTWRKPACFSSHPTCSGSCAMSHPNELIQFLVGSLMISFFFFFPIERFCLRKCMRTQLSCLAPKQGLKNSLSRVMAGAIHYTTVCYLFTVVGSPSVMAGLFLLTMQTQVSKGYLVVLNGCGRGQKTQRMHLSGHWPFGFNSCPWRYILLWHLVSLKGHLSSIDSKMSYYIV